MTPGGLYRELLRRFGRQGWWPLTPPVRGFPRKESSRLEVIVGAILTQNTAWTNVEKALYRLRRADGLSLRRLTRVPVGRLASWIRPSGYFRQKADKLKRLAAYASKRPGGLAGMLEGPLPARREEWLSLHGVGPETADSILLYAGGKPTFVIDAYTLRIGSRLGWFRPGAGYGEAKAYFEGRLPNSARIYAELHALLVALAKYHCRKDPLCRSCPALPGCRFGRTRAAWRTG